jgi:hypothetical protein|tara:strand:- start:138 stop:569 length:432 start_codon:yes stop_codon:yes gene_type:complete
MSNSDQVRQLQTQIEVLWEDRHKDAELIRVLRDGQEYFLKTVTAQGLADVIRERIEQLDKHCHSPEHDAGHDREELAKAAVCYAAPKPAGFSRNDILDSELWPFERAAWKPTTRRRDLVKAAALILAEIDRLDAMEKEHDSTH